MNAIEKFFMIFGNFPFKKQLIYNKNLIKYLKLKKTIRVFLKISLLFK